MQETRNGSMAWPMVIVLAIAIPVIVAMGMIGMERVFTLARTLVASISIAIVLLAVGFVVRMYRKQDITGEQHYTHDGTTKVIEHHYGAPASAPLQLADGKRYDPLSFPEYFRAAYQAGAAPYREGQRAYAPRPRMEDDLPPEAFEGGDDIVVNQPEWIGEFTQ